MFTKQTPTLGLPQWQPNDHPDFLTDINEAFMKLDENAESDSNQQTQIDELTEQIVQLTNTVKELEEKIDNMGGTEGMELVLQMKEDITKLQEETAQILETITYQGGSIQQITAHLTLIDSDITTMKQNLATYKANIDANTTAINKNTENIYELENSLASLQATITSVLNRLSTVEQTANTNKSNISQIQETVSTLQTSVSNLTELAENSSTQAQTALNTANLAHDDAERAVGTADEAKESVDELNTIVDANTNILDRISGQQATIEVTTKETGNSITMYCRYNNISGSIRYTFNDEITIPGNNSVSFTIDTTKFSFGRIIIPRALYRYNLHNIYISTQYKNPILTISIYNVDENNLVISAGSQLEILAAFYGVVAPVNTLEEEEKILNDDI